MHESLDQDHHSRNRKKVKSGCKTCKTRRVKCDESRPACRRCVSTGQVCDGYGIWGGGGSPYGRPQSNRALSTYCTPLPVGSMTSEEQTYFDWFMAKTTKKFAGLFTSDFWETLVLQASAQEPAVRHALVALSAAHRFDRSREPWSIPSTYVFDVEQFTLQQYNKAIHHLRLRMGSTQKNTLRVALVTCMIFVTLEYLRGQYQMGSAHLRYAIQLLASISAPKPRSSMSPSILSPAEDFTHTTLIDSYSRLTVQAAMQYYTLRLSQSQSATTDPEMVEIQRKITTDLSLWRKAYNASLARLEEEATRKDKFGNILLRVYHEMATIMASVCLSDDEMIFDNHTERFLAILKGFIDLWNFYAGATIQIKEIKHFFSTPESDAGCHGFTVESGFIPPVYYTALKCQGVWNGPLLARVLEEVVSIEEGGAYTEDISVDEPMYLDMPSAKEFALPDIEASKRISDVAVILPDEVKGDTFMSYKKQAEDGQWETYKRKVKSGWMNCPGPR
ncbi:hypothetical protein CNMCM5623_003767 [Aspergillus felis]|uniref:Zn(2)-C6 fungal-type domain-containing protein n=1 Tax=Aspergillus felis TaxID=1287682 RepID=A0A8H6QCY5_9EURO|nr:hypothetical protein CNMCM5623_003767 [Aspergillus felis]